MKGLRDVGYLLAPYRNQRSINRKKTSAFSSAVNRPRLLDVRSITFRFGKIKTGSKDIFQKTGLNYYLRNLVIENLKVSQIAKVLDFKSSQEYTMSKGRVLNEL